MCSCRLILSRMLTLLLVVASGAVIPTGIAASQTSESFLCVTGYTPQWSETNLETAKRKLELSCAANIFNDEEAARELEELRNRFPNAPSPPQVQPNEPIESYLLIIHGKNVEQFPFFVLVDGIQTPFRIEDQRKRIHYISVPREDDLEPPLEAHAYRFMKPGLSPGLHNVFPTVDATVSQVSRSVVNSGGTRFAGSDEPPAVSSMRPPDSAFMSGTMRSDEESALPHHGLFLSRKANPDSEEDVEPWDVTLRPGERLDYFIQARPPCNEGTPVRSYWVSVFVNSRQIPIHSNVPEQKGVHLRLACNEEATIPVSLTAPQEPGQYRLYPLGVMNPYRALTEETPVELHPRPFPFFPKIYTLRVTDSS